MNITIVYTLNHIHHNSGYKQNIYIGTFQTVELIKDAIIQLKDKIGFNKFSIDSFIITKHQLNDYSYWENGFQTLIEEIDIPL